MTRGCVSRAAPLVAAALCVALSPQLLRAQVEFPARARAALHVFPERVGAQATADRAFGLRQLLDAHAAPRAAGDHIEHFILYTVATPKGFDTMGVTRTVTPFGTAFEKLRGARRGSVGGHALYAHRNGAAGRLALVGRREIAEGSEEALRIGLQAQASGGRTKARRDLERSLRRLEDPGGAATLIYLAPPEGANLVQIVDDLGAIWGPYLASAIEPYQSVLGLLGSMQAARADVWQEDANLGVRIVLVTPDAGAAKRSHLALRTARGLAPMASKAAVRAGSMTQEDAEILAAVLQGLDSQVENNRILVTLSVPGSIVP